MSHPSCLPPNPVTAAGGGRHPIWFGMTSLVALVVSGCQYPQPSGLSPSRWLQQPAAATTPMAPGPALTAPTGYVTPLPAACGDNHSGVCQHCAPPIRETPFSNEQYRPRDEYVCDGGDRDPAVRPGNTYEISDLQENGWNLADTVAQYDTPTGRKKTSASTRACIYAPRFAAVRRVTGLTEAELHEQLSYSQERLALNGQQRNVPTNAVAQPVGTVRGVRNLVAQSVEDGNRGKTVDDVAQVRGFKRRLLPFENLQVMRTGTYHSAEKLRLATSILAAETWTDKAAVQVTINGQTAIQTNRRRGPMEAYEYELVEGSAVLRIVKVASTDDAHSGDEVHFTIRFDNMGDETLSNIVLADNLTTRLEYVDESQECSVEAQFHASDNNGESLLLRWELANPLAPNEGGVIRFTCRVR